MADADGMGATVIAAPSLRDRVREALRRAYPNPVESAEIRNRYGRRAVIALNDLAHSGEIERVGVGVYRRKVAT